MGLKRFFGAAVFGAVLFSCADKSAISEQGPAASKWNVLILVSDSLRPDRLSCYGHRRSTSPAIDGLAREGVLFERAHSHSSFTRESVSAILTGVPPAANASGTGWYASPDPERRHLDGMFREAGYTTGFFSDHAIFVDTPFGKDCAEREIVQAPEPHQGASAALAERTARFIREHRGGPFMAYVHFLDPHDPYHPAPEYYARFSKKPYPKLLDMFNEVRPNLPALVAGGFGPGEERFEDLRRCYDAEIAMMDDGVRAILDALRETGALDRTIVVFTADHGEEFLEHGFVEHAWSLYEETVHVPLIMWRPGLLPAGREKALVSHCDLFPTLAALTGLTGPGANDAYGSPLFSAAAGKAVFRAPDKPVFMHMLLETRLQIHAVAKDGYKYIASPHWLTPEQCSDLSKTHYQILMSFKEGKIPPPPVWGPLEHEALYNLDADPEEGDDLLASEPAALETMRAELERYREGCPKRYFQGPPPKSGQGLSEEERERLLSLGYLGEDANAGGGTAPETGARGASDAERERLESLGYLGGQ